MIENLQYLTSVICGPSDKHTHIQIINHLAKTVNKWLDAQIGAKPNTNVDIHYHPHLKDTISN